VTTTRFRYPRTAYIAAGLLAICLTPMVRNGWLALLYVIPVIAVAYIARTGTDADHSGLTVRTLLGSERLSWSQVSGLRVGGHGELYAVIGDQQMRLPTARVGDLQKLNSLAQTPDEASAA